MTNNLTEKSDHGWNEAFLQPSGGKKNKNQVSQVFEGINLIQYYLKQ